MGQWDSRGSLVLSGRLKDIIALPNGMKVYPEDIENALRVAGLGDTVVLETRSRTDRGRRAAARRAGPRDRAGGADAAGAAPIGGRGGRPCGRPWTRR